MGRSVYQAGENLVCDLWKGAACFELVPGRRYGLMRSSQNILGLEIYDIRLRRLFKSVKALEPNSIILDTYALPLGLILDATRLALAVYEDQGVGSKFASTSLYIASGWGGGYAGAFAGYRAGELIGGLFGHSAEGIGAVVLGYLGGVFGAHFGNRLVTILRRGDNS